MAGGDRSLEGVEPGVPEWSLSVQKTSSERQLSASPSTLSLLTNASICSKPKILLMGLSKSGKTSIRHVIFHKMSANETQFLESTPKIDKIDISSKSFLDFQLWDFPGKLDVSHLREKEAANSTPPAPGTPPTTSTLEKIFLQAKVLIFVIDPMEEKASYAIERFHNTIMEAHKINPRIKYEVFIHKSDSLNDDQKVENVREITHSVNKKLRATGLQDRVYPSFKTTSIYDHSIFEAMSMVCQQLLENVLPPFENILNAFVSSNMMEKAFIFDIHPKIFIASDSSPFDMPSYELCCDMLDLISDFGCIYQDYETSGLGDMSEMGKGDRSGSMYSVVKLNDSSLHLMQINRHLALLCIQPGLQEGQDSQQGILDYNFQQLKIGIKEVLKIANL